LDAQGNRNCTFKPSKLDSKSSQRVIKEAMSIKNKGLYEFGNFRLDADTDTLWQEDQLISLSPKAFELLKLLVINQGNIVSKDEIFETVWADTFVEDGVLTQNIYTLRNALGKDENGNHLIENIARRGYRISIPVQILDEKPEEESTVKFTPKHKIITEDSMVVTFNKRKYLIGIVLSVVLLSILGFIFNKLTQKPKEEIPSLDRSIKKLDFRRLTDKGNVNFLHISPDGNWLAYSTTTEIFLKDLKSNSEVGLKIENFENFGFLQFSKDGTSIYFRSPEASFVPGNIYQTSRLGGSAKMVAENVWSGFSFSPDGKKLSFIREKPAENKQILIVKDLETGIETEFTIKTPPLEFYPRNFPAWSPDSKKIASVLITRTEHFAGLIVTDIETGKDEEIKTEDFQNVEQVVWSAEGESFIASASDGKNFQLWRIVYPSGKASRITNDLNDYLGISISADGKNLLARERKYFSNIWIGDGKNIDGFQQLTQGFARNEGLKGLAWIENDKIVYTANYEKLRDWNLWVINIADNSRQQITTDSETQNEYPAVSPDGSLIFYSSNKGELANISRIGVSGENPTQITFYENESELFPQTSPEGNWIYYIKKGKNSSSIWRKSLIDEKEEKLTEESDLSPANFLALSPDGKYLAFQNATKITSNEESKGIFNVCVISTENTKEKSFYNLHLTQPFAYFSKDGKALEFIKNSPEGSDIFRQELDNNTKPKSIVSLKKEWIFKHAWSKNGEKLAISRGNLIRDAVVLKGFE
jgi:DNA-binding winged helix-turn-helix (wHTH) protein/Tol biopolymer transport system component